MSILNQIRTHIVDDLLFGDDRDLTSTTSFQEEGIVDSMGMLSLLTFIETTFEVSVENEELTKENFDNLECVAQFVQSKLSAVGTKAEEAIVQCVE